MKRTLCLLAALLLLASLCSCGEATPSEPETSAITTATATAPLYTRSEPPTLLPVAEDWNDWTDGFPILKEPANDYRELYGRYRKIQDGGTRDVYVSIILYDMDGDFVPELLIELNAPTFVQWQVYTMHNGKTHWLGSFWGMEKEPGIYSCNKGGVYVKWGRMEYETLYWLTKQGNKLLQTEIFRPRDTVENYFELPDGAVPLLKQELYDYPAYGYQ